MVAEASYGPTDTDFVAPITKLKSAGCDLVVMGSIIRDSIQSVGTAKKLGWTDVTFVGRPPPMIRSWRRRPAASWRASIPAPACHSPTPIPAPEPIKAWAAKYKSKTGQDPNSAAQYGYVVADIVVKALETSGKDLTRAKFLAALEGVKDYKPLFPGPALSYGADRHQGRRRAFLAKVEGGRWKMVAENLLY